MLYPVNITRMEVIEFEIDAESEEKAEERYLMDGDETGSETVSTTVNSVTASPLAQAHHDLRNPLADYFARHTHTARPDAVSFHTTPEADGKPVWDTEGPTFHYDQDPDREEHRDIPAGQLPDTDFAHTPVAHALTTIGNAEQPRPGDTLHITLPTV
ncbi:hypothetical protein [Streptomyces chartreusis]|uniref:hypothetical protein n=1 Tax=Streptomyces chartreusis TaxID=1969 RepID=UPI002F9190F8|nr:hypothetical protein OG938_44240 [Streptomyces chartreusis]WSZ73434.1 hypothetical protein OG938_47555 [Streptomyces chartreusis]WTA33694.1 hypothetical protein OIA45_48135 [Streptomyces chartreusis]